MSNCPIPYNLRNSGTNLVLPMPKTVCNLFVSAPPPWKAAHVVGANVHKSICKYVYV